MLTTNGVPSLAAVYHVNGPRWKFTESSGYPRHGTVSCLRSGWLVAASKFLHKVRAHYYHYDLSVILAVVASPHCESVLEAVSSVLRVLQG